MSGWLKIEPLLKSLTILFTKFFTVSVEFALLSSRCRLLCEYVTTTLVDTVQKWWRQNGSNSEQNFKLLLREEVTYPHQLFDCVLCCLCCALLASCCFWKILSGSKTKAVYWAWHQDFHIHGNILEMVLLFISKYHCSIWRRIFLKKQKTKCWLFEQSWLFKLGYSRYNRSLGANS